MPNKTMNEPPSESQSLRDIADELNSLNQNISHLVAAVLAVTTASVKVEPGFKQGNTVDPSVSILKHYQTILEKLSVLGEKPNGL